jgi:hypothetical protein
LFEQDNMLNLLLCMAQQVSVLYAMCAGLKTTEPKLAAPDATRMLLHAWMFGRAGQSGGEQDAGHIKPNQIPTRCVQYTIGGPEQTLCPIKQEGDL